MFKGFLIGYRGTLLNNTGSNHIGKVYIAVRGRTYARVWMPTRRRAELLERILLEYFEAEDVQHPDSVRTLPRAHLGMITRLDHAPARPVPT